MGKTKQRQAILTVLSDVGVHLTADQVYEQTRRTFPNISKGTVYRNLNLMADENLIRRVHIAGEPVRFDSNRVRHQHKVCVKCGGISDIGDVDAREILRLIAPDSGVVDYDMVVYVVCGKCECDASVHSMSK
ncbi:MAG: transcriptional repressor [Firmicutes bacterium]|nr:transcriptional repressor [Bacillota bacterium]